MINRLAFAVTMLLGLIAVAAASAAANPPSPVTLHESVTFGTGHGPPVGVFTADGLPQCSSGAFVDHLVNFNLGGHTLVVDRTYACDGGGGGFTARMVLHNEPVDANGTSSPSGEWTILQSNGTIAGTRATGTTSGVNSGCAPTGTLFFSCQTGVSTVAASIV